MKQNIKHVLKIIESEEAFLEVEKLFKKKFHTDAPKTKRHFSALYSTDGIYWQVVGYIHYEPYKKSYLAGGFLVDETSYKKMPKEHRRILKENGGIATYLLKESIKLLGKYESVWAYVGNPLSKRILLNSSFKETKHKYLLVLWGKSRILFYKKYFIKKQINGLGPF